MVIRWKVPFTNIHGVQYVVEIYDAAATIATPITLTGAAEPFTTTESEDDDLYAPIHNQSGYIRIVLRDTADIDGLYSERATDRPVLLRRISDAAVVWAGFVSGDMYNQPWQSTPYSLEIPVVGIASAMKGVDFTQDGGYVSLASLLTIIASYLPEPLEWVYPFDVPADANVQNYNFQEYLTPQEREDAGTENVYEVDTIYNILENFCKYFGISLHEDGMTIWFFAHDAYSCKRSSGSSYYLPVYALKDQQVCSTSNTAGRSSAYRFVKGTFKTNATKVEEYTSTNTDAFKDRFEIYDEDYCIYRGNSEVTPHLDDMEGAAMWNELNDNHVKFYGQIRTVYTKNVETDDDGNVTGASASSEDRFILYMTQTTQYDYPVMLKIALPHSVAVNHADAALLHINFSLSISTKLTEFSYATYICARVRYGDYVLQHDTNTDYSGSNYKHYPFKWVKESEVTGDTFTWLYHDNNGKLVLYVPNADSYANATATLDYDDNLSGIYLPVPDDMAGSSAAITFEFVGYMTSGYDFSRTDDIPAGIVDYFSFYVTDFQLEMLYYDDHYGLSGVNKDENVYSVRPDNNSQSTYEIDCEMTTRRFRQHGTGLLLDVDGNYIAELYDKKGIMRRAEVLKKQRDTITVHIRSALPPLTVVEYNSRRYATCARSTGWRDADNKTALIDLTDLYANIFLASSYDLEFFQITSSSGEAVTFTVDGAAFLYLDDYNDGAAYSIGLLEEPSDWHITISGDMTKGSDNASAETLPQPGDECTFVFKSAALEAAGITSLSGTGIVSSLTLTDNENLTLEMTISGDGAFDIEK